VFQIFNQLHNPGRLRHSPGTSLSKFLQTRPCSRKRSFHNVTETVFPSSLRPDQLQRGLFGFVPKNLKHSLCVHRSVAYVVVSWLVVFVDPILKALRQQRLVKIGAKIIRHGRPIRFQMAEVMVPRSLFAEILTRIAWLRAPAALA
jgi:hypothetical protein